MFNIDVHIERIQNGYIVTENDSTNCRRYYSSLESFVKLAMLDLAKEEDRYFSEHDTNGHQRHATHIPMQIIG